LSWLTYAMGVNDIIASTLPTELAGVEVYVDDSPAGVLYVSESQINFIVPVNEIAGDVTVRVAREGVSGPEVTVTLVNAAPELFGDGTGYAIATHADGTLLTSASPAQGGEIVVIYATGMGATEPNQAIPQSAAPVVGLASLSVSLDGVVLPSFRIKYAGATPLSAGLYQINLEIPQDTGTDPVIQVTMGTQSSAALQIAVE